MGVRRSVTGATVIIFGAAIFLAVWPLHTSSAQDYSKVISIVEKMETSLKAKIDGEQKTRQAEVAELRAEIEKLKREEGHSPDRQGGPTVGQKADEHFPVLEESVALLKSGNDRYVRSHPAKRNYQTDRVAVAAGQHPYAIVLTCADSRVPPELIFDETLGRLFVIRDAGNVVDSVVLGSIEYAAEHLHAHLLVILGHQSCGAVMATIGGGDVPPNIGSIARRIKPSVDKIRGTGATGEELLGASVEENVRCQMDQTIAQSGVLKEMVERKELSVVGAVYNLVSGKVDFLNRADHDEGSSHGH